MTWSDYGAVAMMGLLGGAHCAGMCAPFALAVSVGAKGKAGQLFARHLAYQIGKATAYVLVGVLLMLALGWVEVVGLRNWISWAAGVVMMVIGLGYALGWRWSAALAGEGGWTGRACGALRALWSAPSLWRCVLTGWVNGFLPCGLSLAALLFLASRDSVGGMVAGAYVFGLGTMPALLALGWLGERVTVRMRGLGLRAAGVGLVLFGVVTIFRGVDTAREEWCGDEAVPSESHEGHGR